MLSHCAIPENIDVEGEVRTVMDNIWRIRSENYLLGSFVGLELMNYKDNFLFCWPFTNVRLIGESVIFGKGRPDNRWPLPSIYAYKLCKFLSEKSQPLNSMWRHEQTLPFRQWIYICWFINGKRNKQIPWRNFHSYEISTIRICSCIRLKWNGEAIKVLSKRHFTLCL